jgi:hypothetical protein
VPRLRRFAAAASTGVDTKKESGAPTVVARRHPGDRDMWGPASTTRNFGLLDVSPSPPKQVNPELCTAAEIYDLSVAL